MFLRSIRRWKDGKEQRYWSVVENPGCKGGRILLKTVLYLGEINDSQKEQWIRAIEVFDEESGRPSQLTLFGDQSPQPDGVPRGIQVCLDRMEIHRPRQWGACWLFTELWRGLHLDIFWRERLGSSREGTDWEHVLQLLCCYRLLEPGSERRLHRHWFDRSAMADLLDEDFSIAAKDTLYRCHDLLLEHKSDLFTFLRQRWEDLFDVKFDILLCDLTSTYLGSSVSRSSPLSMAPRPPANGCRSSAPGSSPIRVMCRSRKSPSRKAAPTCPCATSSASFARNGGPPSATMSPVPSPTPRRSTTNSATSPPCWPATRWSEGLVASLPTQK
jgi:hypothetical protein